MGDPLLPGFTSPSGSSPKEGASFDSEVTSPDDDPPACQIPEWEPNSPYYNPRSHANVATATGSGSYTSTTRGSNEASLDRQALLRHAAKSHPLQPDRGGEATEEESGAESRAKANRAWGSLVASLRKENALQRARKALLRLTGPHTSSSCELLEERRCEQTTSDGRRVHQVGSMVMYSKPYTPPKVTSDGGTPALGCFVRQLKGKDGANCTVLHPSGRVVITGGSEKASREWMAPESGWLQIWERSQDDLVWSLHGTMTGEMLSRYTESLSANGHADSAYIGDLLPPVTAIATHPHLALSATGHGSPAGSAKGGSCYVVIWCMASHVVKNLLTGHTGEVTSVVFHEERPLVVSSSKGSTVRVWNFETGGLVYAIEAHEGPVSCMKIHSFIRNYSHLMGEPDSSATPPSPPISKSQKRIQDLMSKSKGAIEKVAEWEGLYWTFDHKKGSEGAYSAFDRKIHKMMMGHGAPMPDDLIITCGEDKSVAVWDLATGELLRRLKGHQREITDLALFKGHCPEGDVVASSSFDRTVRIWHIGSGACTRILHHEHWALCLDFNEDGLLATGNAIGNVSLWDIDSGSLISSLRSPSRSWLKSINFVPGQDHIMSLSLEGRMSIWEYKTCPSSVLRLDPVVAEGERKSSMQHNLVLTPDGTLAASSDHEYLVRIWDVASGKMLHTLGDQRPTRNKLLRHYTSGLAFSPCKTLIAVGAPDEVVRVYRVSCGSLVAQLIGHSSRVCSLDFHPTRDLLATASFDTTVRLWDTKSWTCTQVLEYHREWVTCVAFSPDGLWLASGGWDDRLVLYHMKNRSCCVKECYSNIWTLAWQPESSPGEGANQVSVGTSAGMLHHFQLDELTKVNWKECGSVLAHEDIVSKIVWDPVGKFLISGSLDNSVRLWGPPRSDIAGKNGNQGKKNTKRVLLPLEQYALFAKFPCAVVAVCWAAQPPSRLHKGDAGLLVGVCTTTAGMFVMDGTDAGQFAVPYFRASLIYEQGGADALREVARVAPLSLTSMGPGGQTILHDIVSDVSLLQDCLKIAVDAGIMPTIALGQQPLLAEAYAVSELAVGACVDSILHVSQAAATGPNNGALSFIGDVGTATLLMLITGYPEQAARLLAATGLQPSNEIVYDEKWRDNNPRFRMKSGSVVTRGSYTQHPAKIWGPHTVPKHRTEREVDVIAACPAFQYAAGIPPGQFHFDQGFSMTQEEHNSGLERSVLHLAFNKGAMEILDTPIGRAILDYKWVTYGRRAYYRSMTTPMLLIIFTTLQSTSLYMVTSQGHYYDVTADDDVLPSMERWSKICQAASLLCGTNALWMLLQEINQFFKEGWRLYLGNGWNILDMSVIALCLTSCLASLSSSIPDSEETHRQLAQPQAWAQFACMVCWMEVFNMLRADSRFGLIVRMIINIANDIKYLIFLQAFLCLGAIFSFIGLFRTEEQNSTECPTLEKDLWNTLLRVYAMLLGNVDLDVFQNVEYAIFYQIMFLAFVYMHTILLLNLVIAMMGESFEKVLQAAQKELTADRAELLIRVELSLGVATMRKRGYLPRYLQVLIPKAELTATYDQATSNSDSEWAGVAGTVTSTLLAKLTEQSAALTKTMQEASSKKIDSVTHNLMTMKKDLKDHMNSLEERLVSASVSASSGAATWAEGGADVGGADEYTTRLLVREELARMLQAGRHGEQEHKHE